jgi:hypothetical protein
MAVIRHKTFVGPIYDLRVVFKSWAEIHEEVRAEAEAFMNQLGGERILAISESSPRDQLVIAVWYRDDAGSA